MMCMGFVLVFACVCASFLPLSSFAQVAPTPSSSDCQKNGCLISWTTDPMYQYQLQVEDSGTFTDAGTKGSFVEISPLFDLWECRNVTVRILVFDGASISTTGVATNIPVKSSLSAPPTPQTPSLNVLGSDRIEVSATTTDLSSSMHWIDSYTFHIQKAAGGAIVSHTVLRTFPGDAASSTISFTFSGLDDNTRYDVWVSASSCAGVSESSMDSVKTSLNIIIDDGSNDPLYLYWHLNVTGVPLVPDAFSTDLFFAAVSTLLSDNSFSVPRTDMGVASFEVFQNIQLVMLAQFNVTVGSADAIGATLQDISFPPCASDLTRKLKEFSSSQFRDICVSFESFDKGALNKLTDNQQPTSSPSTANWKLPTIISGAAVGGIILVGIIVYLIVQVARENKSNRVEGMDKIDLDIELSQATLY
eukprot:m.54059 g.54059  ORF g.54059 m.54059 type:complete len:418 (+) comp7696_c1_seq4:123-1376(+)